jgi:hypothetical protein
VAQKQEDHRGGVEWEVLDAVGLCAVPADGAVESGRESSQSLSPYGVSSIAFVCLGVIYIYIYVESHFCKAIEETRDMTKIERWEHLLGLSDLPISKEPRCQAGNIASWGSIRRKSQCPSVQPRTQK